MFKPTRLSDVLVTENSAYVARIPKSNSTDELEWVLSPLDRNTVVARTKKRMMEAMLLDVNRNSAYENAIRSLVKPGDVVIDAGTGTGLLAMIAARAGAKKVFAIEMNDSFAELATKIIFDNKLQDVVTVIAKRSDELTPEDLNQLNVDILITETMDSILTTEGILETTRDIKSRFGRHNNFKVIPTRGRIFCELIEFKGNLLEFYREFDRLNLTRNSKDPLYIHADASFINQDLERLTRSAQPIFTFDFGQYPSQYSSRLNIRNGGIIDFKDNRKLQGILIWWKVQLEENFEISTSPSGGTWQDHWHHTLYFVEDDIPLTNLECIDFNLHPETGKLSFQCLLFDQSIKKQRATENDILSFSDLDLSLENSWQLGSWHRILETNIKKLKFNDKLLLIDLSKHHQSKLEAFVQKNLPNIINRVDTEITVKGSKKILATFSPDIFDNEIQGALFYLYQCAFADPVPFLTIPRKAYVKCTLVNFKTLSGSPLVNFETICGFDHKAISDIWKAHEFHMFDICLSNYEHEFATEDILTLVEMNYENCQLIYSQSNARISAKNLDANGVVFWVDWILFSPDEIWSLSSPFVSRFPASKVQVQFLNATVRRGGSVQISCLEDPTTNQLNFRTEIIT